MRLQIPSLFITLLGCAQVVVSEMRIPVPLTQLILTGKWSSVQTECGEIMTTNDEAATAVYSFAGTGFEMQISNPPQYAVIEVMSEADTYRFSTDKRQPDATTSCGISFTNISMPFQQWTIGITHNNSSAFNTSISSFSYDTYRNQPIGNASTATLSPAPSSPASFHFTTASISVIAVTAFIFISAFCWASWVIWRRYYHYHQLIHARSASFDSDSDPDTEKIANRRADNSNADLLVPSSTRWSRSSSFSSLESTSAYSNPSRTDLSHVPPSFRRSSSTLVEPSPAVPASYFEVALHP